MNLADRAKLAHQQLTDEQAETQRARTLKERAELVEAASAYARAQLKLESDWQSYIIPDDAPATVLFTIDGVPLRYHRCHQDYRLNEMLSVGRPCPNLHDDAEHHDLVYVDFYGLEGLGRALAEDYTGRPCWECQRRLEEDREAGQLRPMPTAGERLVAALETVIRDTIRATQEEAWEQ